MKDWLKTLATVAPTIATAMGSPLAGAAVHIAAKALGVDNSEDSVAEAVLAGNPDALVALKQAEHEFKVTIKELDLKEGALHSADRDSARKLAMGTSVKPQLTLSVAYTIAYAVVLYCFMAGMIKVPEEQQILFGSLIGILTSAQVQILNFWFGSSAGSKEKTIVGDKADGRAM